MNVNIGSASSQYTQREIDLIGSDSDCEIETMRKINVYYDFKKALGSSESEPDAVLKPGKARGRPRMTDEEKAAKKAGRNETKEQKIAAKEMKKKWWMKKRNSAVWKNPSSLKNGNRRKTSQIRSQKNEKLCELQKHQKLLQVVR